MEINGTSVNESVRYAQLDLSPALMRAIEKKGYVQATPVQAGAIPYFMEWKDVIAKAPTGTGKTFAFGIPMVEHIDPESSAVQALVLAPTRELAIQIQDELRDLCAFKEGVRVVCLYGGQPIEKQITQLKKSPQIVVATPGRLMDHMKRHTVRLDQVQTVVLDEADRMLDMGDYERVIAFCNTKNMTDRLAGLLSMRRISCEAIHGDIQQRQREKTLQKFRDGQLRVLVATDVAARGLDIDDVDAVFNYDVPDENEYYIHRIGRTGRAKRHGVAFSLVSTITEGLRLDDIQKVTGSDIRKVYFNERGDLVAAVERP